MYDNQSIELAGYFAAAPIRRVEPDGTHDLLLVARTNALEPVSDTPGLLAPITTKFTGGDLEITERIHADGSQDATVSYRSFINGPVTEFKLAAGPAFFDIDGDGFPVDDGAFAFGMPFSLTTHGNLVTPDLGGDASVSVFPAEPSTNAN